MQIKDLIKVAGSDLYVVDNATGELIELTNNLPAIVQFYEATIKTIYPACNVRKNGRVCLLVYLL